MGLFVIALLLFSGCVKESSIHQAQPPDRPQISISPFPEADALFRKDKNWLGGDGASSIDLGNEEVLWLFGDTFIGTDGSGNRKNSVMIRNSIAIQKGYDPTRSTIRFYFRRVNGKPMPYFSSAGYGDLWPSTGILLQDTLFVFLMTVVPTKDALGFDVDSWRCLSVRDRKRSPDAWEWHPINTPSFLPGLPLILSFVFPEKAYVYGFLTHIKAHSVYLCRWPINDFSNERLMTPHWWSAEKLRWIKSDDLEKGEGPTPLFPDGQMEFTVLWQPELKQYMLIQTQGFGNAPIGMRRAEKVTGPWSSFMPLFSVPGANRKNLLIYAAKFHPEQKGGPFLITYAVNSLDFNEVLSDNRIYFPCFLKGRLIVDP